MALHYNYLDVSETVFEKLKSIDAVGTSAVKKESVRLDTEEAYALRAAVVAACEVSAQEARHISEEYKTSDPQRAELLADMNAVQVDGFLWSVAKDGKLREIPRIAERGTVFY